MRLKANLAVLCSLSLVLSACSEGTFESSRLNDLKPIMFNGQQAGNGTTKTLTTYVPIGGTCDKTISDIKVSNTASGAFASLKAAGTFSSANISKVLEDCRKTGKFEIDILASNLITFSQGQKATKEVYFKAVSGSDVSSSTKFELTYLPEAAPKSAPGISTALVAGWRSGNASKQKLRFKIGKPVQSVIKGTNQNILMSPSIQ